MPLGYQVQDRKLIINEAEASTVRHIFSRYIALGSGQALIKELLDQGYRTKLRPQAGGRTVGGVPFQRGALFHLLGNRVYLGEVVHKELNHAGEHPALIDQTLWNDVQATMERNRAEPHHRPRKTEQSMLTGILRDVHGRQMSPSHASKGVKRYRYYVTHSSGLIASELPACRVPAADIETIVTDRLAAMLTDKREMLRLVTVDGSASVLQLAVTSGVLASGELRSAGRRRQLVAELIRDVQILNEHVAISVARAGLLRLLRLEVVDISLHAPDLLLTAPAIKQRMGKEVRLLVPAEVKADEPNARVAALLAEAVHVRELLLTHPEQSIEQMALQTGRCRSRTARLLRLSFTAPKVAERILEGEEAAVLASKGLAAALPLRWDEQQRVLFGH